MGERDYRCLCKRNRFGSHPGTTCLFDRADHRRQSAGLAKHSDCGNLYQAEEAVLSDKEHGYVAIKVYSLLSPEGYAAIVAAAQHEGLPVVGHVPRSVGLDGVLAAHQDSIEHLDGFLPSLQPEGTGARGKSFADMVRDADFSKLPAIAQAVKAANSWVCPTLVVNDLPRTDSTWLEEASYVPPAVFDRYRAMYPNKTTDPRTTPRGHAVDLATLTALHRGGVRLLLGTDTVKPGTLPGFSLHEELENFVAAGMTPYEAIRAGTADAAEFLNQGKEFGVVAVGRRADLLLLNANPLEDVKNIFEDCRGHCERSLANRGGAHASA